MKRSVVFVRTSALLVGKPYVMQGLDGLKRWR